MAFSFDLAWDYLQQSLKQSKPVGTAWAELISFLEKQQQKPYWPELKKLKVEQEQDELTEAFEQLLTDTPLSEQVVAIWFGIVKFLEEETGREVYVLYLTGSATYSSEDIEWATEPVYDPPAKYLVSDVLTQADEIVRTDAADYSFLDWLLPLAYTALTLNELLQTKLNPELLLKYHDTIRFATGHDSGDFVELAPLTRA